MSNRDELLQLIRELAYVEGDFTLSPGRKSDHHLDLRQVMLTTRGARLVGGIVLSQISWFPCVRAIGGNESGAIPIVASVLTRRAAGFRQLDGFWVRNEPKGRGRGSLIEGHLEPGWGVAIVDDVATSGRSIMDAVRLVEDVGAKVLTVIVLVDREQGAAELFRRRGIDFRPVFTVGEVGGIDGNRTSAD